MSEKGKKKNVLLLCLSTVKPVGGYKTSYSFTENPEDRQVEGYLTNEAPAKSTILKLAAKKEWLDEVIVICSEAVRQRVLDIDKIAPEDKRYEKYMELKDEVLEDDKERFEKLTHVELYKSIIQRFSIDVSQDYESEDHRIKFKQIDISNDPEGKDVIKAAVEAAERLEELKDGFNSIDLYIDHNGGQRYIAFMLVAIANLAKVRGVEVKEILSMNFEQKKKIDKREIVPVQNTRDIFECIDLVSGVHEYINYGRTKMLRTFFKGCENEKINNILNEMQNFSYEMQLCNTDYVFAKSELLKNELTAYKNDIERKADRDNYEELFSFVVEDILNGYKIMLEGDLPEIISWCIDNDYIQQALTFYAERMPYYFWTQGVFKPTAGEEQEYEDFLTYCKDHLQEDSYMINDYKKYFHHYYKEYSWMISFLYNSKRYKEYTAGQLMRRSLYRKDINVSLSEKDKIFFDEENEDVKKTLANIERNVDQLLYARKSQIGRARSILNDDELKQVLTNYFVAKELRNTFNHADAKRSDKIQYGDVCDYVKDAMKYLRDRVEEKKSKRNEKEMKKRRIKNGTVLC